MWCMVVCLFMVIDGIFRLWWIIWMMHMSKLIQPFLLLLRKASLFISVSVAIFLEFLILHLLGTLFPFTLLQSMTSLSFITILIFRPKKITILISIFLSVWVNIFYLFMSKLTEILWKKQLVTELYKFKTV